LCYFCVEASQKAADKPVLVKKKSFAFKAHPKCVVCKKTAYPKESIALNDGQRVHSGLCLKVRQGTVCACTCVGDVGMGCVGMVEVGVGYDMSRAADIACVRVRQFISVFVFPG